MRQKRHKPSRLRPTMRAAAVLAFSFTIIAGCSETTASRPSTNAAAQEQAVLTVKAAAAAKLRIAEPVEQPGEVAPSAQFDIIAKAGGEVEQLLKKRGDAVQEGEPIARLRSDDIVHQQQMAALGVKSAQDAIAKAKQDYARSIDSAKQEMSLSIRKLELSISDLTRSYNKIRNDYDTGAADKEQVTQAEIQLRNARLDLEQLQLKQSAPDPELDVSNLEIQLKNAEFVQQQADQAAANLTVKAPVGGLVTELPLDVNMPVQTGAKIGVVQRLDPVKIVAFLTEDRTKMVTGKTELSFHLPDAAKIDRGKISYLSSIPDPQTKGYEIDLEVPNKDMSWKPGTKLRVQLTDEQDLTALAIPASSIVQEGGDAFVYVVSGGAVEKRAVKLGRVNDANQEVLSGLKEGEQVVISNPSQLTDKEKVRLSGAAD